MDIKEVLALDRTLPNAKKIDHFLSKTDKYTTEYLEAFCYKMVIWGENNRINDALKEVYSYVPYFSEMVDEDVIIICDTIMHITLRAQRLDEYQKYLQVKLGRLPSSRLKEKYRDSFYYYLALKDYNQARIEALEYSKFNNTKEENIKIELELLSISELLRDEETFNIARKRLEELFKDSFDFNLIADFHIRVLRMLYTLKNYSEAKSFALELLNDPHLNNDLIVEASTIYLKILLLEHEYKKGTIFEADYVDYLKDASPKIALEFAKTALKLYEELDHKISIDFYNDLINGYEEEIKKNKKASKKHKEELIIIPDVLVEKPIAKNKEAKSSLNLVKVEIDNNLTQKISEEFNVILEGVKKLLNFNLPLRENLRLGTDFISLVMGIKELDILYLKDEYHLHKYKNKRVYDKKYNILMPSLQKRALEKKDILYFNEENLKDYLDLFYQKEINYMNALAMPLYENDEIIGVLTVYSDINILENENRFTAFLFVKEIYNLLVLKEINKLSLELSYKYENYIFSTMNLGFRILRNDRMLLSPQGASLLGLNEESSINDFYLGLKEKDKNEFLQILNHLTTNPENNKSIIYAYEKNYQTKYFKETFFTYFNEELVILSLIEDVTENIQKLKALDNSLSHNDSTGLYNKHKLFLDILAAKDKCSLLLFSLANIRSYIDIYGHNFYLSFINALTKGLNNYFSNKYYATIYQVTDVLFCVMLKTNIDKRLLQSRIKELLNYLEVGLVDFNYNIEPHYNMGVLRLEAKANDPDLIYDHLYDSYLLAKEEYIGESNFRFFSQESYKIHFKNRVIEANISEALDTNKMEILYQQIVDIKNKEVYGYYAKLNIVDETFTEAEINEVISLKNLNERLDKYKLMHVASDLRRIYSELKGYFEIFLEISNVTLTKNIVNFIKAQLSFFKIPANMINIIVDDYNESLNLLKDLNIGIITKNIYDIINHKADSIILDYNKINFTELHSLINFISSYKATIILGNVNNITLDKLKEENVRYLFGDIYKKSYPMIELINKIKA